MLYLLTNGKKKSSNIDYLQGYIPANAPLPANPNYTPQTVYTLSYLEWAMKNREQIFKSDTIFGGTSVLYTVPQGTVLYIFSAFITNYNSSAAASTICRIETPQGVIISSFVPLAVVGQPNPHESTTAAFPVPLKLLAGTIITLVGNSTANSLTNAGFIGFLEFLD